MKTSLLRRTWVMFVSSFIRFYASTVNRFRVVGAENIPPSGGVLIASNHISGYETVLLPGAILKQCPFQMVWAPAKEELFRNFFLGTFFRSLGAFPVKRRRDVRAGQTLNTLLRTEKVMIYPEGTRHRDGVLGKGNRGVGKLIYDTRPQVVPTALSGLNRWRFPGAGQEGRVVFGKPIDFSDLYRLEDCKETHVLIVERVMDEIGALLPPSQAGEPRVRRASSSPTGSSD